MVFCLTIDALSWFIYLFATPEISMFGFGGFVEQMLIFIIEILVPFIIFASVLLANLGYLDIISGGKKADIKREINMEENSTMENAVFFFFCYDKKIFYMRVGWVGPPPAVPLRITS